MNLKKYIFLITAFAMLLGILACDSNSLVAPDDLNVDGSYFIIRRTYTADGEKLYNSYPPDINGVLTISSPNYTIEMEGYATEVGTIAQNGINIDFYPDGTDLTLLGTYELELEQIKLNYTAGSVLFAEVWQKATIIDSVSSQ